jgi:DNA polymerase alpha subunit A
MVCDTHLSSLELIRETNYELDFLAEKHLGEKNLLRFRNASMVDAITSILSKIDQGIMDAHLSLRLCQKLQLVQLNKQLTNASGCFWYQSFQNLRAERNEMLLMHTFYRNNFIFPDKYDKKFDPEGQKKGKKREKAKYEGGLVLEPKSGLYQDYILLLDFNSLYPSIIREYKICFTTVRRNYVTIDFYDPQQNRGGMDKEAQTHDEEGDEDEIDQEELLERTRIPDHNKHCQILPRIIHNLIKKRKDVKEEIKRTKDAATKESLNIKQQAYKLIANSIYGCLGFKNSRFYAQQMAALITYYGRNLLKASSQKVAELGYDVVYGDTDSLMINSREKDLGEALKKGVELKKQINSQYRSKGILEIDVDGIFRSLLLLKKKKYAADKLQNLDEMQKSYDDSKAIFKIELKGLDIVRRDWSGLTKNCGEYLVNLVLGQEDSDTIRLKIYDYLANLKADLESSKISMAQFTIFKQLNKSPKSYNDKGQPHVMVAKKMQQKGLSDEQLIHHFIPYVICKPSLT